MMPLSAAVFALAFVLSALGCAQVLNYARRHNLLDRPNERSLHKSPVPRGGGAAILIATTICLLGLLFLGYLALHIMVLWIVCGLCIGLLGWIDDHRGVATGLRFFVQVVLAVVFITGLLRLNSSPPPALIAANSIVVTLVGVLGMVWMINLTNFMDGSDGYAASEGLLVAGIGGILVAHSSAHWIQLLSFAVAGSAAGFLIWNWHPAKIFMGDVGSYFLGFQFAAVMALDVVNGFIPWTWLILLAPFVVDASLTLGVRVLTGRVWWKAHREHLYQRLILDGYSHQIVALGLIVSTVCVLAPLAFVASTRPAMAPLITAFVYALAVIIWVVTRNKIICREY